MSNHISHASLPYPIKGARYTVTIPYLDADGDPTDPTTPDTEISKDAAAFTDCAEEASTISGSNGTAYLTLTGAEMDCTIINLAAKVASGPKATLLEIQPRVLGSIGTGTLSAGSAGGGTLGTILAYDLTNCFIKTTGGTGGGGTGGANNQARRIVTYTVSTGAFTVEPNWETTPDNTTTYSILLPEGITLGMLKTLNPTTPGATLDVATTGEAGLDFSNLKQASSGTTLNNITIPVVTAVTNGVTLASSAIQAIWDALTSALTTSGSIGKYIIDSFTSVIASLSSISTGVTNVGTDVTTLTGRLTAARAGYLDNLNVGGAVASQSDITALNQSASRRIIITTVQQYERPESSSTNFQIEARTYDGDGAAVNADSTPTLTATGIVSGSLAANLSAASNPSTGVYRWTYNVTSAAALEQIRFDLSATIGGSTFTIACFAQTCDLVAATWTTSDASKLTSVYNAVLDGTYGLEALQGQMELGFGDIGLNLSLFSSSTANSFIALTTLVEDIPTVAEFNARTLVAASYATAANQSTLAAAIAALQVTADDIPTTAEFNARTLAAASYATAAALATAQTSLTKFETMIALDGAVYRYTANALELAPAGGGGGGGDTVILGALIAAINPDNGVGKPVTVSMYQASAKTFALAVYETDGVTPVDLSTFATLEFNCFSADETPVFQFTLTPTVSGASNEIASVAVTDAESDLTGAYNWVLRDATTKQVLLNGRIVFLPAVYA